MDNIQVRLGKNIKHLRKLHGISQEELAERCMFARSYMSRLERGKGNPSLDALEKLAKGFDLDVKDLF